MCCIFELFMNLKKLQLMRKLRYTRSNYYIYTQTGPNRLAHPFGGAMPLEWTIPLFHFFIIYFIFFLLFMMFLALVLLTSMVQAVVLPARSPMSMAGLRHLKWPNPIAASGAQSPERYHHEWVRNPYNRHPLGSPTTFIALIRRRKKSREDDRFFLIPPMFPAFQKAPEFYLCPKTRYYQGMDIDVIRKVCLGRIKCFGNYGYGGCGQSGQTGFWLLSSDVHRVLVKHLIRLKLNGKRVESMTFIVVPYNPISQEVLPESEPFVFSNVNAYESDLIFVDQPEPKLGEKYEDDNQHEETVHSLPLRYKLAPLAVQFGVGIYEHEWIIESGQIGMIRKTFNDLTVDQALRRPITAKPVMFVMYQKDYSAAMPFTEVQDASLGTVVVSNAEKIVPKQVYFDALAPEQVYFSIETSKIPKTLEPIILVPYDEIEREFLKPSPPLQ
jgi:hypothetical protein